MNIIQTVWRGIAFSIFFVGAFMAGHDADAQSIDTAKIPVIGKTTDGKYNVYDLDGAANDLSWFSGNYVYKANDLLTRLDFVKKEDIDAGTYYCEWVCLNKDNRIVGQPYWNKKYLK